MIRVKAGEKMLGLKMVSVVTVKQCWRHQQFMVLNLKNFVEMMTACVQSFKFFM